MFNKIVADGKSNSFILDNETSYLKSARKLITSELKRVLGVDDLKGVDIHSLNEATKKALLTHPHITQGVDMGLVSGEHYTVLNRQGADTLQAKQAILDGNVIFEHTAAGAATRLGLGTKYTITPMSLLEAICDGDIRSTEDLQEALNKIHSNLYVLTKQDQQSEEVQSKVAKLKGEEKNLEALKDKSLSRKQINALLVELNNTINLSLGVRKIAHFAFATRKLAIDAFPGLTAEMKTSIAKELGIESDNLDVDRYVKYILSKQTHSIILNQDTDTEIIDEIVKFNFFGFNPKNLLFMVVNRQPSFSIKDGEVIESEPVQLHNHGVFRMHTVMENQFFRVEESGERGKGLRVRRSYLPFNELRNMYSQKSLFVSNNIEDLDQLENSPFDLEAMSLGLELMTGKDSYAMVMMASSQKGVILELTFESIAGISKDDSKEIHSLLAKNGLFNEKGVVYKDKLELLKSSEDAKEMLKGILPGRYHQFIDKILSILTAKSQKGGFFAVYNGKTYCYESDQAPDLKIEDIKFLNKNVNMFNPVAMLDAIKEGSFPVHTTYKDGVLLPQTPQGDLNFVMNMRIVVEEPLIPLRSLKQLTEIPATVDAFNNLDAKPDFSQFVDEFMNGLKEMHTLRDEITAKVARLGTLADLLDKAKAEAPKAKPVDIE
ncbi:MAG: hypothetical protein PHF25_05835 [Candidatus Margulisbacteria bacterium]|nr:hypothetical protein [Candidatus Margulisiibacteriota bacterium]